MLGRVGYTPEQIAAYAAQFAAMSDEAFTVAVLYAGTFGCSDEMADVLRAELHRRIERDERKVVRGLLN